MVEQGDPLSPVLFNTALEEVMSEMNWENKGLLINGNRLNNLRYADDIALIAGSKEELKDMIIELERGGEKAGLKLTQTKQKSYPAKTGKLSYNAKKM